MKILLVDNLVMPEDGSLAFLDVHPNLGLLAIAAVAEAAGHAVEIFDPKRLLKFGKLNYDSELYERVASDLISRCPDAIGFTTLGCSFLFAVKVAEILKRKEPDLPILLGGPHATMLDRQILENFEQFDVIVRHEADEIFPLVLEKLERRCFEGIPGISWRASAGLFGLRSTDGKPKVENLDSLPIISYDHYPVAELGLDLLRIEAGRGCPFMCTFCSTAGFFQRSFRLKSAERLVRELDILHARYGFSDFKLDHDMFTVNRKKVMEFCEAVQSRGYRWRASARVDCVDPELLTRMAEAGCVSLYFGIETGSARMQEICKKRLDLNLVLPTLDVAEHVGIETTASFITGYPEELDEDQDDTLDLLGRCFRPSCLPQLHMLAPEPGTPMFAQLGHTIQYDGYGGRYNALLVSKDDQRLILDHPEIFQTYYYYPAAMSRSRHIFAVEAVDLFRRVGALILGYTLRGFNGLLSKLIADFQGFCELNGHAERPNAEMIERFLISRFGESHHLVSLYRYAARVHQCAVAVELTESQSAAIDLDLPYVLNSQIELLAEFHDCGTLLRKIESDPLRTTFFDESEVGERGAYLIKRTGSSATCYHVELGIHAILEIFEQPHRCAEVVATVRRALGLRRLKTTLFEALIREGIIVRAAHSIAEPFNSPDALAHESIAL